MSGESDSETTNRFTAGFTLLDKFQDQWNQIHSITRRNVVKAKAALMRLDKIERSSTRHLDALDYFITSYKSLPKLEEQIQTIHHDLRVLETSFSHIEDLLIILKRYKEQRDAREYELDLETNYELQVIEMQNASRERRERLKQEHLGRVEAFEREQQKELEERRDILKRAFEEEKTRYLEKS